MSKKLDYENTVKKLAEVIFKNSKGGMDLDDCFDYADGIFNDLGVDGRVEYDGLVFIETEEAIQVKKQSNDALLLEIK